MEEKKLRKAIDNAIASMEIEGFSYSEMDKEIIYNLVTGKITKEALLEKIIKEEDRKKVL